jgi:hypothetical protein
VSSASCTSRPRLSRSFAAHSRMCSGYFISGEFASGDDHKLRRNVFDGDDPIIVVFALITGVGGLARNG